MLLGVFGVGEGLVGIRPKSVGLGAVSLVGIRSKSVGFSDGKAVTCGEGEPVGGCCDTATDWTLFPHTGQGVVGMLRVGIGGMRCWINRVIDFYVNGVDVSHE